MTTYPPDSLEGTYEEDDGTMPANVAELANAVVGHRIVSVEPKVAVTGSYGWNSEGAQIVLDNGKRVTLVDTSDCCAYTTLEKFLLHPELVDHMIMGVGTTGGYTTWHIFADAGDVLELSVDWSCGNAFWYGYGFEIVVDEGTA